MLAAKTASTAPLFDAFKTAVIEIATNILRHAYPPNDPNASLTFKLMLFDRQLEAIFYDHGIAFTHPLEGHSPNLDDIDDILDVPEGRYGLFLALQALDSLNYSRSDAGINEWHLIKLLR